MREFHERFLTETTTSQDEETAVEITRRPAEPWYQVEPPFTAYEPFHGRTIVAELEAKVEQYERREGVRSRHFAQMCLDQKKWKEAEYHFGLAAEALVDDPEPHIGRAVALNALGRHDESLEAFESAFACGIDLSERGDIRAVYEAALQRRRFEGNLPTDDEPRN